MTTDLGFDGPSPTVYSFVSQIVHGATSSDFQTELSASDNDNGNENENENDDDDDEWFNLKGSWQKMLVVTLFCLLIVIVVIGNTLVILAVLTTRRLRTVTNCFVMSLAVADWLVGLFVLPPAVMLYVVGTWQLGWILCDIWISLDVLLCTASILSLCAISVDRYLAVTRPLTYSKRRRSKRLALFMIFVVWVVALAITCPPILGWYEPGRRNSKDVDCRYNQNKGYVVFSAMGSFFIPMAVMLYVYSRICCVLTTRHHSMATTEVSERTIHDVEPENLTSEFESSQSPRRTMSFKRSLSHYSQSGIFELNDSGGVGSSHNSHSPHGLISGRSSGGGSGSGGGSHLTKHQLTVSSCRCVTTGSGAHHKVQLGQSQMSIAESCLSTGPKTRFHCTPKRIPIRISSLKRETKTAQTLSMVVGGFIACWLPFFIYYLFIPFIPRESVSETLMAFLTWLGWINSAINPFIYAFYNADFRIAFWRLTFRKICKTPNNNMSLLKN